MKTHIASLALMLALSGALPVTSFAFSEATVDEDTFAKTEAGVGVYKLNLFLGGWGQEMRIPVLGVRNQEYATRENRFGYTFTSGDPTAVSDAGTATALIIASAPIEDGYYVIPAGRFVAATVLAVLTVPEEEGNTYRFSVTNLPFLLGQQETPGHYSDAELIPLSTKYEALHYQRDSE